MTKETHKLQSEVFCLFGFYLRNISAQQLSVEGLEQQETLWHTHRHKQTHKEGKNREGGVISWRMGEREREKSDWLDCVCVCVSV